jgi:lysophospholipase L1-like esterase
MKKKAMEPSLEMDSRKIIEAFMENDKRDKIRRYKVLNQYVKKGQILLVGSSLMEQFPIYEFIQDYDIQETIYNRGVGGYTTRELLEVLDPLVFELEPSKIFINIGTNDLNLPEYSIDDLIERYERILRSIIERLPQAKIYVMAYYPVNGAYDFGNPYMKEALKVRTNDRINEANRAVEKLADCLGLKFINVNKNLFDEEGNLHHQYSIEGMHMYANGYRVILENLMKYIRE